MVLDGDPVDEPHGITVNELRRQVQMVFQDSYASLNPRLTIAETLAFAPRAHGLPAAEARERARPSEQGRPRSGQLRHALSARAVGWPAPARQHRARARAQARASIILDEAVSALDKSVEAQVLNMLEDLKQRAGPHLCLHQRMTSTSCSIISDRVLVMYLGKIDRDRAGRGDLWGNPQHPYTQRAALGAACRWIRASARHEAPLIQGDPPNPIDPPSGCRFRTRCPFAEGCVRSARSRCTGCEAGPQAVACHARQPGSGHSLAQA
jgi:peptide/nickel transport system ATP-binding protein